jgi:hypothetical protein
VAWLTTCSFAFRAAPYLSDKPLSEDGFYAMTIARNIALGHGITIDGTTWTNGFQPLWVMATVPLFGVAADAKATGPGRSRLGRDRCHAGRPAALLP